YRRGSERAPIRLVLFDDYECKDCHETELQLAEALQGRSDISVSPKNYPLCKDCNRTIKSAHFHDHACRAAEAAEAAGILGGNEAFWKMRDWLVARSALFSDDDLLKAAGEMQIPNANRLL